MEKTTDTNTGNTGAGVAHTSLFHSPRILTSSALALIMLATFLFAQTLNALKEYRYIGGGVPSSNTVSVQGEGEVFAVPDIAEFTVTVEEEGATAGEVQQKGAEKGKVLIDALKEKGIEEVDIKTVAYELQPRYEWQPATCVRYPCDRKQVQSGFTLRQNIRVMVRDMDKAGELISLMSEKGAGSVGALTFTVADEDAKREEARRIAITNAKENAETLASDLGVRLVRVVGFYEESDQPMPYMMRAQNEALSGDMALSSMPAPIPAGENQMVARVTVTYEVR